jgi:hypothetical protein
MPLPFEFVYEHALHSHFLDNLYITLELVLKPGAQCIFCRIFHPGLCYGISHVTQLEWLIS